MQPITTGHLVFIVCFLLLLGAAGNAGLPKSKRKPRRSGTSLWTLYGVRRMISNHSKPREEVRKPKAF